MTTLDPDRHKLPSDVALLVQYNTADRSDFRLFVTYDDWPRVVASYQRLRQELPELSAAALNDGMFFGCMNRDVERLAAKLLGVSPLSVAYRDLVESSSARPRGRPPGSKNNEYPFNDLVHVGDSFLVEWDSKHTQRVALSNACSQATKDSLRETGRRRRYVSHKVSAGLLVLLVEVEGMRHSRVVKFGGTDA